MNSEKPRAIGRAKAMRIGRIAVAVPIVLFAIGAAYDLFGGLEFWRSARSTGTWAAGVLAFGTLYVIGEAGVGWIDARDKTSDPLWRRVLHLAMLAGLVGACVLVAWAVWSEAR